MSRLHRAARLGKYDSVADCLSKGMDVNSIGFHNCTALMLAAGHGFLHIVRLLLKDGADTEIAPSQGTPLHAAASKGHLEVVKALVTHGANVNAVDRFGCTPAIDAARLNHVETVSFLLAQGTDPGVKSREGFTAAEWLEMGGLPGYFKRQFPNNPFDTPEARAESEQHLREQMTQCPSADEYAAIHGRNILIFGYGNDEFDDKEVQAWAHRVAEVLFTPGLLAECEEKYLAGEDLEAARKHRRLITRWKARHDRRKANGTA
jgi:hypothetical protein